MALDPLPRGRLRSGCTRSKRSPSQLADEIFVSDGYPEVGYEGDRRIRLRSVVSPLVHAAADARAQAG